MVSHGDLGIFQMPAAGFGDAVGLGIGDHRGDKAGRSVRLQGGNGQQPGAILVIAGIEADQVCQGRNTQLGEQLRLFRADARQNTDGIGNLCHDRTSLIVYILNYIRFPAVWQGVINKAKA